MSAPVRTTSSAASAGLALYAKLVVASVFGLIFIGGLVTSWGAGMAVPDWPLSNGSLNPNGWWSDFPTRLEHGHRLVASLVGVLTLYLTGWVWGNRWIKGAALLVLAGIIYSFFAGPQHAARSPSRTLLASFWFAGFIATVVGIVTAVLFKTSPPASSEERTVRFLSWAAFVAVCLQATLGGLRVTGETAGMKALGLTLRIFHGCVAQGYLVILVVLAVMLTAHGRSAALNPAPKKVRVFAWIACSAIYLQLIFGAVMRHLGAGLAIPTFPTVTPSGSWLPGSPHNLFTEINFAHTRVGALLVTLIILHVCSKVFLRLSADRRAVHAAATLLALLAVQVTLGILVVLHGKPPTMTTFHVLNGAALLATSVVLALRLQRTTASPEITSQAALSPSTPALA